ncbi:cache domain-containing protein [Glaciecola sp. MH2013]|uniref:cache domain-containing protein n=1 Tax=Glaciecola sp. MH2013 TaxID=2785524 RepID=UPI00189D2F32|nr:cache domain-containing protein [Glaciecola sp. MH2013]MBF7074290.1 cache domain-containing protein [Glaciecola sp. MH2013]
MNIFRTLHRSILILFAVVVISIVTLVHFSMTKIVAEQSRSHQASLSPAVKLVVDQVIEPLHIAETLSKSQDIIDLVRLSAQTEELDTEKVFSTLARLENQFNMGFFLALEKQRKQFNSDGSTLELIEGSVNWYFKYKDSPQKSVGDIGKWEDTHFFIDIKIFDEKGEFLGFFGVAKSLSTFIDVFAKHKQSYGHDFIFVDPKGNIMLSSDPLLNATQSKFNNLQELNWYQDLLVSLDIDSESAFADNAAPVNISNQLITINGEDVLLAQVNLDLFNWTMVLMSPLNDQQTEISQGFIFSVISVLAVIFILFLVIYNLLYYFRKDMQSDAIVLPHCKMVSDEQIKYLIDSNAIRETGYLVLIQLNDFYQKPLTAEVIPDLVSVGTKVSEFLVESVHKFNDDSQFGKVNESQWLILLQNTNDKHSGRFMENIRHGLATIQTQCEKEQALLNFSTCKVKIVQDDTFVSAILRLKPALDSIRPGHTERP